MNLLRDISLSELQLNLTVPYPCSYLADRVARSQVVIPSLLITPTVYSELVRQGFRRSGTWTYRPSYACQTCIPVRVQVASFMPDRAQRRTRQRHMGLETSMHALQDKEEHFVCISVIGNATRMAA